MTQFENSRIALVGVDLQNDFIDGSLAVSGGEEVVAPFNTLAKAVRATGGTVILTRDWHPSATPHFAEYGGTWPIHCVADTHGAELHPALQVAPTDIIVNKGIGEEDGYSGYEGRTDQGTTLEQLVQPAHPRERVILAIGGLATDYCVLNTVLDATQQAKRVQAARQGVLDIYTITDTMRAVNLDPQDEQRALDQMSSAGVRLMTSQEFREAFAL